MAKMIICRTTRTTTTTAILQTTTARIRYRTTKRNHIGLPNLLQAGNLTNVHHKIPSHHSRHQVHIRPIIYHLMALHQTCTIPRDISPALTLRAQPLLHHRLLLQKTPTCTTIPTFRNPTHPRLRLRLISLSRPLPPAPTAPPPNPHLTTTIPNPQPQPPVITNRSLQSKPKPFQADPPAIKMPAKAGRWKSNAGVTCPPACQNPSFAATSEKIAVATVAMAPRTRLSSCPAPAIPGKNGRLVDSSAGMAIKVVLFVEL